MRAAIRIIWKRERISQITWEVNSVKLIITQPKVVVKKTTGKDWKKDQPTKLKFSYKEQKEYETIDDDIAALEEKIEELEQEMLKNATNSAKLSEIMVQKDEAESALEEKMERWVYLNDLAEKIATQG